MTLIRTLLSGLMLSVTVLLLAGCPQTPLLNAAPKSLSFGTSSTEQRFYIENTGEGELHWTLEEVFRADIDAVWEAQEIPWLSLSTLSGVTTTAPTFIELSVDRSDQAVGLYTNYGVRITSDGGELVIPVSMQKEAVLSVSPAALTLAPTATSAQFSVLNLGETALAWQVDFLDDPNDLTTTRDLPEDLYVTPNPGSTSPGDSTAVAVSWAAGRDDFYLLVSSASGSAIVRFLFSSTPEGLRVSPESLTLFVDDSEAEDGDDAIEQASSTLTLSNSGAVSRTWQVEALSLTNPASIPPISISPATGTVEAGSSTEIAVTATDGESILTGSGNYSLRLTSGDGFMMIPVTVEILPLPEIAISEPPQTDVSRPEIIAMEVLDFGREDLQLAFWIANTGARGSDLYFKISHDDEKVDNPLLVSVDPMLGAANGSDEDFFLPNENIMVDGVPVTVTVNRNNMTEDVEFRTITVVAMDQDYETTYASVEAATLQVRVERPPMKVEGAVNRSRPPYVMRFAFLLRDTVGKVIPTQTSADLERISFTITEDNAELDLNETAVVIGGPEDLKVNMILMLDYTGSMYNAGTDNDSAPLLPGQALARVNEAAKEFLDDLPESYSVALMYHNDRPQPNRLIHPFTTDRAALKAALDAFYIEEHAHGVTAVRDALIDGITRLVAEDPSETLPFDDADLRAIVFITDGRDNSSVASVNEVTDAAHEARVRLYPLTYSAGSETNAADMLVLAEETGGHLYSAGNAANLVSLLANEDSLILEESPIVAENRAYFKVVNGGQSNLNWSIAAPANAAWITSISPQEGRLAGGASTTITLVLDPTQIGADAAAESTLNISSDNGAGTAMIRAEVGADATLVSSLAVSLRDEPGLIWSELRNHVVLTYLTPKQEGDFTYAIRAQYRQPDDTTITGFFEEDGVFYAGDPRSGQIAMRTTGITENLEAADPVDLYQAEIYVRTDYTPRGVNRFRMRFFLDTPTDIPAAAVAALEADAQVKVEIAPEGVLVSEDPYAPVWRLLASEDHVYDVLTAQDNPLPYGAFGDLLKITITGLANFVAAFDGLSRQPEFRLEMRMDNNIYYAPASTTHPSDTVFFLYPSCSTYPLRQLSISTASDLAACARTVEDLVLPVLDPEDEYAWDRDEDMLPDFNDPYPEDEDLPGYLVVPNPYEIESDEDSATLLLLNNRLDSFSWSIDEATLPAWITGIAYGTPPGGAPTTTLAPGESETITLTADRSTLDPGFSSALIALDTDFFGIEEIPITIITPAE